MKVKWESGGCALLALPTLLGPSPVSPAGHSLTPSIFPRTAVKYQFPGAQLSLFIVNIISHLCPEMEFRAKVTTSPSN